jgi:hypothetical protein
VVAIHPVVSATDAADDRTSLRRGQQLLEVAEPRAGHGVSPVEHDLDGDARHVLPLRELEQRQQMRVDGMHAARANEADEMQRAPGCLHTATGVDEDRVLEEASVLDGVVDADEILLHHTTRAEVEVTDLAVAHLSARQPDRFLRRRKQGTRRARPQPVPGGNVRHRDRVALALGAVTPPVEDEKDDRRGTRRCGHVCGTE